MNKNNIKYFFNLLRKSLLRCLLLCFGGSLATSPYNKLFMQLKMVDDGNFMVENAIQCKNKTSTNVHASVET